MTAPAWKTPPKYDGAQIGDFPQAVQDAVFPILEEDGSVEPGLLVFGNVGTGKTHLAHAIMHACGTHESSIMLGRAVDWIEDFRREAGRRKLKHFGDPVVHAAYNPAVYIEPEDPPCLMDRAQETEIVIIDDLGAHRAMSFSEEQLYALIDWRTAHEATLVVTTNLTKSQLTERNPRVADRLRYLKPIPLTGDSKR